MFNICDDNRIENLINFRPEANIVEPLYVKSFGKMYGLDELDSIEEFSPSDFKVGYGSSEGLFVKRPFDVSKTIEVTVIRTFVDDIEALQCSRRYYVFESSYIDDVGDCSMYKQMNYYYEMLFNHVEALVNKKRKERLSELLSNEDDYVS
jgi:hypothetical protein